jgi:PAS domain S-box-containing protein
MVINDNLAPDALIDLALFQAKMSPDGRLLHFARGRIGTFWLRQSLTAFGSITIALLADWQLGLYLAGLALAGEGFDLLLLWRVVQRLEHGRTDWRNRALVLLGGAVQSGTISACVALCWQAIPIHESRFFAAAFLASAGINAGLARPLYRPAANLRLMMFLLTGFAMMAVDLTHSALATSREYGFFAAGFALLNYISLLLIRMLERNYEQRRDHEFTLLTHQYQQQLAQQKLAHGASDSQRLALVAKYAHDSIVILDPMGRIEWVNDGFCRITGYDFAEAIGQFPADLLNAPDTDRATLDRLEQSRAAQIPVRVEILNRVKSGRLLWMETSINPIFDEGGRLQLWVAVERDISEAKEREAELARARLAAEEAGQSKSRFLANMSHEIRTPMNGVIGVAELLAETPMSPAQSAYVETIRDSGKALLAIINDILDLAKLQSGTSMLEQEPFSPRACVERALRILGPDAQKKAIKLRLDDPGGDPWVIGDEGKLRQIVLNLAGNAVKFTQVGAVGVTMTLPTAASDLLEIAIHDSGIGIAPDRLQAIFDSFSQADDGISRQFGGTGLGLTICAMLAEGMGGGIDVRSELGKGSVFTLRARLPLAEAATAAAPPQERRKQPRVRAGLTVMAAEDNRTNMMILRKMLQGTVANLIEVQNGDLAVTLYRDDPPDVILMDISMPVKDGLQAAREIRAWEGAQGLPHCPIIALTANAFGEDREAARLAGFDGFLVKPLSRIDLLVAISGFFPEKSLAHDPRRLAL